MAIFAKMESASSIEDYTIRVAQAWQVGQKDKKNGIVLFVFVQDRKMFIQVGYGLEGELTDAAKAAEGLKTWIAGLYRLHGTHQ